MKTTDFYSDTTYKGWSTVTDELVSWVNKIFPSSGNTAKVFQLSNPVMLSNGQHCGVIILSHGLIRQGALLIQGMSIVLSQGMSKKDLCDLSFEVFFNQDSRIGHIVKSTHSIENGKWKVQCENFYSDEALTDGWKFETMLQEIMPLLERCALEKSVVIPSDHPLINRYEVGRIEFRG